MNTQLQDDTDVVDAPRSPVSELLRTTLGRDGGASFLRLGTRWRDRPPPASADELWDYLGDFA